MLPVHQREKSAHHQRPSGLVFKAQEEFLTPILSLPDVELGEEPEDDVQNRKNQIDRRYGGEEISFSAVGGAEQESDQQRNHRKEKRIRPSRHAARLRVHQRCNKIADINRDIGQQHAGIRLFFCPDHADKLQHGKQINQCQHRIVRIDHQGLHSVSKIQKIRAPQRRLRHNIGRCKGEGKQNLQRERIL